MMKYKDFFNIEESPVAKAHVIFEGWAKPMNLTAGMKSKVNLSLADVQSVPTKFKLYFTFTIQFESGKIRQYFEKKSGGVDVQSQIKKSMSAKRTAMVSIEPKFVDYKRFYFDMVRTELSAEKIKVKLLKFAQAGTYNLEDFSITNVEYPIVNGTLVNDAILWKQFTNKDKKNAKASPIKLPFGYSVEFSANNKLKMYSRTEIINLAKEFVPEFEQSILKDTEYVRFTKSEMTAPLPEQNVYGVPLNIWKPGQNDAELYIDEQLPNEDPNPTTGELEKEKGAVLKGDSGKKITAALMSAINFAIGKFGLRELRPGTILSGIPELIRIVRHAYQMPPEQEFPKEFIRPNIEKWLNGHDPARDGVPIIRMEDGRLKILKDAEIKKIKDAQAKERAAGGTVPVNTPGGVY
jgi:hypothetical protein